jgi:GGDEF domain-containing protein
VTAVASAREEAGGSVLWKSALDDEITRAERGGTPLSLLLVELEEADRVRAIASPLEASSTFGRFAQAVRGAVRRQDILACENESRAWIIARDTGRLGAQALAARVVGAVGGTQPWRGAPMDVSVGLAMLREDGRDGQALIEAAEESLFAASASGSGFVAGTGPQSGEPGPET